MDRSDEAVRLAPDQVEDHPGEERVAGSGARITLLYVRPASAERTELDRRIGAIAERYARWVDLRVVGAGEEAYRSPALLLLRAGEVVGEAMGALLPMRELDDVVRRAVEWPVPA